MDPWYKKTFKTLQKKVDDDLGRGRRSFLCVDENPYEEDTKRYILKKILSVKKF